ncbi:LysE family transporter [Isoptericola halotolerans]|uniref:Arginine exporter protein ArgO n=1 Tax=Isoptericola halotolerans TaxID=300560 RepID=A0ABX2A0I5_9MICO|nr:LysE family transporter [Isoptericola halotolerans]NOV96370.1 arginine exporter protein ArgO [Isoptericola halotolerans]
MEIVAAFGSGAVAGLGVAVPLGAIGVLLVREGMDRGLRGGAAGAVAVALVDTLYCGVAVVGGAVAAPLADRLGDWPTAIAAVVVLVIAASGVRRAVRAPGREDPVVFGRPSRRFLLFLGLTAINPVTLVYFTAIAIGFQGLLRGSWHVAAFVVGVALASLAWQLLLVGAGSALRHRISVRLRKVTTLIGNGMVAALGVAMLFRAIR